MTEQTSSVAHIDAAASAVSDAAGSVLPATETAAGPGPAGISKTGEMVSSASGMMTDAAPENVSWQGTPVAVAYDAAENITGLANSVTNSTQVTGHDSSLSGNGVSTTGNGAASIITENGVASADAIRSAVLHQSLDDSALSAEEERLWNIVTTNSLEFDAWTALIDETERTSEGNISKIRKVYDTFLVEFPLCYGYWKKYADHEARLSSVDKVAEVYERAVQGVTYSVDMWLHYCVFAIGTYVDPDIIRRLFERALAYVGSDYLCFPLWDKYIEYEISQQAWSHIATIYTRVLEFQISSWIVTLKGLKSWLLVILCLSCGRMRKQLPLLLRTLKKTRERFLLVLQNNHLRLYTQA